MDSLTVNKAFAAVLVGGIAFMVATIVGDVVVHPARLKESAIKIEGAAAEAGSAPPPGDAAPAPIGPLLAAADPAAGEATTKKLCVACHSFNEGGKAGVGPNLYGVVGGPHGHMEGFSYSAALKGKQGPWTFDELNEWLKKPSAYAPGTRMAFAGINNDKQRADVIAYLNANSKHPEPLPAAEPVKAPPAQSGNSESGTGGASAAPTQGTPTTAAAGATTSSQGPQAGAATGTAAGGSPGQAQPGSAPTK